jgi:peptidoglycan/xylan/chitin deacetylase (PgdA/CDA1 family)
MPRIVIALFVLVAVASRASAIESDCAYDPKLSHISRFVAADSTNGPFYGTAMNDAANKFHSRTLNLHDHEIVLTFDDGPLGANTQLVLDTLQKHCVKATFFSVGRMALANPKLLQELDRRGHTVGTHTWSHPRGMDQMSNEDVKLEIEKGFAAVSQAMGKPIAPFFRFPGLRDSNQGVSYLASRNISVWSVDVISGDTDPGANSARIAHDVVARMNAVGKGIVLFHDIKRPTAEALDGILTEWERQGYKFVHAVSNTNYQPDPELVARAGVFHNSPETATITGRFPVAGGQQSKEQVKDGSVDVMHTEWIDLQIANEKLTGQGAAASTSSRTRSETQPRSEAQPVTYNATGWPAGDQVR